jgi:hypothetical protein
MKTRYLRQWDFDITDAVAAWQRAHLAAGSGYGTAPTCEYNGPGRQSGMPLLLHRAAPVSEYATVPLREYGDHGHPLGMPLIHRRVPLSSAQGSSTTFAPQTVGPQGIVLRDTSPTILSLQIMTRTRLAYERLPPDARVECARDVSRNFRLESIRVTFDSPPHDRVAGLHRDHLLGLCRQIETLRGGPPEREDLVLG